MPEFNLENALTNIYNRLNEVHEKVVENATQMESLIGNGQPGRVGKIEDKLEQHAERINELKNYKWYILGWGGAVAFLLTVFEAYQHVH